jgi:predicted CXXCH cytochrome family protein
MASLGMKNNIAIAGLLLLLVSAPSFAKKHPVPLDEKTDAAKCLECHEAKAKGKVLHSAMALGCRSCHEVRVNREITRIKLVTTTATALCLSCHADKNAADSKGRVHSPAVRNCLKCHDPHASENANQLLKATAGEKNENLCLSCHSTGTNVPKQGSRHAALDLGCASCHVMHKTGAAGEREFEFHLTKASPALCLDCHDAKDNQLQLAHRGQPIAESDCLTCHDPHQSNSPKLLQRFAHQPFAEKSCDTCHQPAKDGKVVLTRATAQELCVTCHEETAKKIETAKVPHAGALGDCTQCHNPHGGKSKWFARPDAVSACLSCHTDHADMRKTKKVLHAPAFRDDCSVCHEAHGGDKPKLLRAEGNALCLNCHSREVEPQKVKDASQVAIFDGKVRLPEDYFNKVPRLNLKYNMGHPTANHPTSDYTDPLDPKKVTKLNCQSCHQPHAGGASGLLVNNARPNAQFCRTCHQGMIGARP